MTSQNGIKDIDDTFDQVWIVRIRSFYKCFEQVTKKYNLNTILFNIKIYPNPNVKV